MFPESSARRRVALMILYLALLAPAACFVVPIHAAPQADLTFTAVGDLGGTSNTDSVLAGIANAGADFHLALGDLSYGSYAPERAWCNYVQSRVGTMFPFELGAGNHDMDGQPTGYINNFVACLPDRIGNVTGTYVKLNAIPIPPKNAGLSDGAQYKHRDKQVVAGKRYFYKLQVVHSDDTGEWSDVLKVKVP
jgi:hypothetical protein